MYSKTEYLKKAIGDNNFLLYNNEERFLYIKNNMISNKEFRSLSSTLEFLQYNRSPEGLFKRIKISDINFAHRDASLTYYCHQFLDQGIPHQETHWIKYGQKTYCFGRVTDKDKLIDKHKIIKFLKRHLMNDFVFMSFYRSYRINNKLINNIHIDQDGWILCHFDKQIYHLETAIRIKQRINRLLKRSQTTVDKIIKTVNSIKKTGWDERLSWLPNGSIIGYSLADKMHFMLTGRHRVAALKYLCEKNLVDKKLEIEFPIIIINEKTWGIARQHPLTKPIL